MHDPTTPDQQELDGIPVALRAIRQLLEHVLASTPVIQVAEQLRHLTSGLRLRHLPGRAC